VIFSFIIAITFKRSFFWVISSFSYSSSCTYQPTPCDMESWKFLLSLW